MADAVNHPPHYKKGLFETIDVIDDICQFYDSQNAYSVGCVVKYISRAPHKGNFLQDLEKAQWYLNRVIAGIKEREKEMRG